MPLLLELRLGLIELVLTAIWVIFAAGATPAALWSCLSQCANGPYPPSPPPVVAASPPPMMMPGMDAASPPPMSMGMDTSPPPMDMGMDASPPPMGMGMDMGDMGVGRRLMDMGMGMSMGGAEPEPEPEPSGSMSMGGMGGMASGSMSMSMCPPPTVVIVEGLIAGFAAAVTMALSYKAAHAGMDGHTLCSGGHFNMAVTLGLALRGLVTPLRLLVYAVAQLTGAALGGALLYGSYSHGCLWDAYHTTAYEQGPLKADGHRVLLSAFLSTIVVLVHMWAGQKLGSMACPILIGFTYIAATMMSNAAANQGSFNPLRAFGVASSGGIDWDDGPQWIDWIGSLLGAAAAALLDVLIYEPRLWRCDGAGPVATKEVEDPRHEHVSEPEVVSHA